jgi:hypothetical protein
VLVKAGTRRRRMPAGERYEIAILRVWPFGFFGSVIDKTPLS